MILFDRRFFDPAFFDVDGLWQPVPGGSGTWTATSPPLLFDPAFFDQAFFDTGLALWRDTPVVADASSEGLFDTDIFEPPLFEAESQPSTPVAVTTWDDSVRTLLFDSAFFDRTFFDTGLPPWRNASVLLSTWQDSLDG